MALELMSKLPEVVEVLQGVIGLSAALKLVDEHGGSRVWVPAMIADDHPLELLLGATAAQGLAEVYGRRWLSVPRCAALLRDERARQIQARYDAGESPRILAKAYRLTERSIWRILKRPLNAQEGTLKR